VSTTQSPPSLSAAEAATFKRAMSLFPSGVTVVTTVDAGGDRRGFTASAFCSVSLEPPIVLACLDTSADCYPAFSSASHWVVNILADDQAEVARRFATKGIDKFAGNDFATGYRNLPVLTGAVAVLGCRRYAAYPGGDHVILAGGVETVSVADRMPLTYAARTFPRLLFDTSTPTR
jgi:Conserved protein/domain typically associated with flavoprotein oxygenases, DIM6/NTAB family